MEEKKEQLRLTRSRWKLLRERIGKNIIDSFQKISLRNEAVERKLQMSEEEQIEEILEEANAYNLRNEVKIEKTSYNVLVTIKPKSSENSIEDKRFFNSDTHVNRIYDENKSLNFNNKGISLNWYDLMRYKNCIPEGIKEIEANTTLPLEINLDLLGGISFEKGCFIGQEVNARVKYKGLVKKKYVPVHFKNKNFSFSNFDKIEDKIYFKKQDIGEVIALSLNQEDDIWYGIGKIKLSQLYLFEENNKLECDFFGSKIKINFPKYMLPLPRKL